jgi:hypothetical protein
MIRRTTPRTTARGLSSILAAVALGFLVAGCSPSQTNEGARETPEAIAVPPWQEA